jgi:mannitol/fructose-specific phosphotransferase system IIA component (Ntr-type)
MELEPYLSPERVLILPDCQDHDALMAALARIAAEALPGHRADDLLARLQARERIAPTGTREGVAFPHVLAEDIDETVVVVARVPKGVPFGEREPVTCDLVFCMFGDAGKPWSHVRLLARMARLVHTEEGRRRLREADTSEDLLEALRAWDRSHG